MKKIILLFLGMWALAASSQTVGQFRYDTTKFYKVGGFNEVKILNSTMDSVGGVFTNVGGGWGKWIMPTGGSGGSGNTKYVVSGSGVHVDSSGNVYIPRLADSTRANLYAQLALKASQQALVDTAAAIRADFPAGGGSDSAVINVSKSNDTTLVFRQLNGGTFVVPFSGSGGGGGSTDTSLLLHKNDSTNLTGFATVYKNSLKQNLVTLTTTGSSGAATFNQSTGALNIPTYAGGSGGSLSSLTAATAPNTIQNANYRQSWQWNTLADSSGLSLSSSSTGSISSSLLDPNHRLLSVSMTGANASINQWTFGGFFSNKKTGTGSTNVAGFFEASGGASNFAAMLQGNTGINQPSEVSNSTFEVHSYSHPTSYISTYYTGTSTLRSYLHELGYQRWYLNNGSGEVGSILYATPNSKVGIVLYNQSGTDRSDFHHITGGGFGFGSSTGSGTPTDLVVIKPAGVGIGTTTVAASAVLDVTSTTQGVLMPRMTTTQKNAIVSPAEGLEVYDLTLHQKSYYNGTTWINY